MSKLDNLLNSFAKENEMLQKGSLCVALIITRAAKLKGLPLNPDLLLTEGGGQVLGLGKSQVQTILKDYGITRVLAEEGGRTSRGSVGNMRKYVLFLNELNKVGKADIKEIENWWSERVKDFFSQKPLILKFDHSKSIIKLIEDLLNQVRKRQEDSKGSTYLGTVLQHLIGAKLELVTNGNIIHHCASVADEPLHRSADFLLNDVAIHVTTSPSEALIRKCINNLDSALRPIIITLKRGVPVAEAIIEQNEISNRIDVFSAEQFLAGNIYELGKFEIGGRQSSVNELIDKYNKIVNEVETDPGLIIAYK